MYVIIAMQKESEKENSSFVAKLIIYKSKKIVFSNILWGYFIKIILLLLLLLLFNILKMLLQRQKLFVLKINKTSKMGKYKYFTFAS